MICTTRIQPRRPAFTLIELLVVVAIIVVMVALTAGAYWALTQRAPINNTQSRIQGIKQIFDAHWDQVVAKASAESPSPVARALAGGDQRRAQVIWVKARLMEAFPMNYQEITSSTLYSSNLIPPGKPRRNIESYKKALQGVQSANTRPETESAACLLIALRSGRVGAEQTGLLEKYTADTDNDGILELVDDWKQPFHFYRFPTENTKLQNSNPEPGRINDPLDPEGTLLNRGWYGSANRGGFETVFHPISPDGGTSSYYTVPTIMSAGYDLKTGLGGPKMNVVNQAEAADNIYSFEQTVGGAAK